MAGKLASRRERGNDRKEIALAMGERKQAGEDSMNGRRLQ